MRVDVTINAFIWQGQIREYIGERTHDMSSWNEQSLALQRLRSTAQDGDCGRFMNIHSLVTLWRSASCSLAGLNGSSSAFKSLWTTHLHCSISVATSPGYISDDVRAVHVLVCCGAPTDTWTIVLSYATWHLRPWEL